MAHVHHPHSDIILTSVTTVITIWRSEDPQRPERFYYLSLSHRRWNPILPATPSTHHQVHITYGGATVYEILLFTLVFIVMTVEQKEWEGGGHF